ncbi:probable acyl-CoA dehydrogenase 6 [Lethenteron reissneri]|uniref:probable acyl-CoA dehydrogenase 6 n=1 Tax=Lethenteron reissneri TaxID=7753 RepID=UPI002AB61406|nr:probable acyl-CoA dehydrogenase 6 [Lethenteron reissneri]
MSGMSSRLLRFGGRAAPRAAPRLARGAAAGTRPGERSGATGARGAAGVRSEEHAQLRSALRKLIEKEINPHVDKWEAEKKFPARQIFKILGDAGFLGVNKPTEYGGLGLDFSYSIAVAEELGSIRCGGVPMAIGVQTDMATPALARFGSDELRREFLAPTIAGDMVACVGVSEVTGGSDVATLRLVAALSGTVQRVVFALLGRAMQLHICLADLDVQGHDVTKLASMAKLKAGRLVRELTDACLQFWGGMGFTNEVYVSRLFRDGRLISIAGGADEVMLSIICKHMGTLPGK